MRTPRPITREKTGLLQTRDIFGSFFVKTLVSGFPGFCGAQREGCWVWHSKPCIFQAVQNFVEKSGLLDGLRSLGLEAGDLVMVHASMRKLGPVNGGADAVLDAIAEVLGPDGTLVMPLGSPDDIPFDAYTSPAEPDIGFLAERFRLREGTRVNNHPAGRFGAAGRLADYILHPVPHNDYLGPGSPLERFAKGGGRVLRMGADADTITLTHYAEYLADLPEKRSVSRQYKLADGRRITVESLDDSDGIVDWAGGDYFAQIWLDYLSAGRARTGRIGNCAAELLEAADFVNWAASWMEQNLK